MKKLVALSLFLLLAPMVHAHEGHAAGTGFAAGVVHPFTGLDHLLAMLAVGVWASTMRRPFAWALPVAFPALMALGAAAAFAGLQVPQVEAGVAASVLVLGLALSTAWRAPAGVALGLVAAFGFFHGFAHGAELPVQASPALYAAGFLLATLALHAMGIALGFALVRNARVMRVVGVAIAGAGMWLLGVPLVTG